MKIPDGKKSRESLRRLFVKNAIPTQEDFADLIESSMNQRDDGLVKTREQPLRVEAGGDAGKLPALSLYRSFNDAEPACVFYLDAASPTGFGIGDATGVTQLSLDPTKGLMGLGTTDPKATLDIKAHNQAWLAMGEGGDGGRITMRYERGAPEIVLSDLDDGPGLIFQNIGAQSQEDPEFSATIKLTKLTNNLSLLADRVGIGTDNPLQKLHVANGDLRISGRAHRRMFVDSVDSYAGLELVARSGSGRMGYPYIDFTTGGNLDYGIRLYAPSNDSLRMIGGSFIAEQVGIGTNSPAGKLQVDGGAIVPSAGKTNAGIEFPSNAGGGSGDSAWLRYYARTGEHMTLELGTSNDSTDHIALMPSGNVGVGTNSPSAKLHVASGDVRVSGSGYRRLHIASDNTSAGVELVARAKGGSSGVPHIDFSIGSVSDFGLRLVAHTNDSLKLEGGTLDVPSGILQENWRTPTFLNGWVNYSTAYNAAGYYKDRMGTVHLRGLVKNGKLEQSIFVLPTGFRPPRQQLHVVCTATNAVGRVDVKTNGHVRATFGSAAWISLDGISFRAV